MGKSGYRKFMKQERAKVKLKNKNKTLLPKGQNVSDLNFKVKKIVIKSQLKEHEADEVLSSRKLNFQEVLSRMGHYSGTVSTEAVGQLESLLKQGGQSYLSSHLSQVVSQLAKLLTSPHSHLRKSATKLLSSVLDQVDEDEWGVVRSLVVGYIVCGLSHVDPNVRSDSLLALDACPSASVCVDTLLPPLLDLMSTSRSTGTRSLNTPLSASPTAHRTAVLSRIRSVLASLHTSSSVKSEDSVTVDSSDWNEVKFKDASPTDRIEGMRVPLIPSYPRSNPLSISNFMPTATLSQAPELKEFASSLIPLMLDSFAEIAPPPDVNEPVCLLTHEGSKLLDTVADVILILYDLLNDQDSANSIWMRESFGNQLLKRLIEKRFPYSEEENKKQRGKAGRAQYGANMLKLNLTLALLALNLNQPSTWTPVMHFLSDLLRHNAAVENLDLLGRCLTTCLSNSKCRASSNLMAALIKVNRSSPLHSEAFSILSKLSLQNSGDSRPELTVWLEGMISDAASPDEALHADVLDFLKRAAPIAVLPPSFDSAFPYILDKTIKMEAVDSMSDIGNLLYWVKEWEPCFLDKLADLVNNESFRKHKSHLINLLLYKCQRYPELNLSEKLEQHSFWRGIITV